MSDSSCIPSDGCSASLGRRQWAHQQSGDGADTRTILSEVLVPSGEHVLRLHRWRLISPTSTLVAEDGRHLVVGELVGERGHRGRVGHAADGLARQST